MEPLSAEQLAARWTQCQRRVEAFIYSCIADFHQTDDILQNVAMVVVRKREEFDPSQPFLPWALQIAKFEVLKHRRAVARDRHDFGESLMEQVLEHCQEDPLDLVERRQAVVDCVKQASPRSREVLLLRYVEDLQPKQIAERLHIGGGAARMMLQRAREAIRGCIERKLGVEEARHE